MDYSKEKTCWREYDTVVFEWFYKCFVPSPFLAGSFFSLLPEFHEMSSFLCHIPPPQCFCPEAGQPWTRTSEIWGLYIFPPLRSLFCHSDTKLTNTADTIVIPVSGWENWGLERSLLLTLVSLVIEVLPFHAGSLVLTFDLVGTLAGISHALP